ncbi:MAG TPA: hypothetical protein VJT75_02495 [Thermoleophilaceae bacterium]|nr:hypothetical protein [Thermoleophilaceae bacterium]
MDDEREPEQSSPDSGDETRAPTRDELLRELKTGARKRGRYKETVEPPPPPGDPGGSLQPPSHNPYWGA